MKMGKGTCFYCDDIGEIPTLVKGVPDQMCPHCEIGQAMFRGYNKAKAEIEQLKREIVQLKTQLIGGSENDSCMIEGMDEAKALNPEKNK